MVSLGAERDERDSSGSNFRRIRGDEKDDRIYVVFLGDMVKNQTVDKEYDHCSVLKTVEDNFSLPPLNSGDANAAPITEAWK